MMNQLSPLTLVHVPEGWRLSLLVDDDPQTPGRKLWILDIQAPDGREWQCLQRLGSGGDIALLRGSQDFTEQVQILVNKLVKEVEDA